MDGSRILSSAVHASEAKPVPRRSSAAAGDGQFYQLFYLFCTDLFYNFQRKNSLLFLVFLLRYSSCPQYCSIP